MKFSGAWKKFFTDPWAIAALTIVIFFILTALTFDIYAAWCQKNQLLPTYMISSTDSSFLPPCPAHILGTDYQGRDVFLRTLAGCSSALKTGVISGLIAIIIGVAAGVCAGYFGGRTDDITVWFYSTFAAMPTLLFILAFALLFSKDFLSPVLASGFRQIAAIVHVEPGMLGIYLAIGLSGWVTLCRVIRGETMKLKRAGFVAAAKIAGVSDIKIIFRHILPNVFHLIIIYFTTLFASAVMLEVIVSYLGMGVQNAPSWGIMIADGQSRLWSGVWWEITSASGALLILVLALNILGDAMRDAFDPRR
ncbi:MAG: ABC transporter permease [Lentisphaeria bacterium]|nr:ABC transporter permease [Lentisphaeria bacterium]